MHSTGRVIHKLDAKDGRLLEPITPAKTDPDPHGMCMYDGTCIIVMPALHPAARATGVRLPDSFAVSSRCA